MVMIRQRTVGVFELDFQRPRLNAEVQIFDSSFALTLDAFHIVARHTLVCHEMRGQGMVFAI